MSKSVCKLSLDNGSEIMVSGRVIIHAIPAPNVLVGRTLSADTFKVGDSLQLVDNGYCLDGQVKRVTMLHLDKAYPEWLAAVDALALRYTRKVGFTAASGANSPDDPWVEMYVDGLTPEEAWDEQAVTV